MLKKLLLSIACAASSFAIADINLDLNLTVSFQGQSQTAFGSVVVKEKEAVSVVFDEFEALIIDLFAEITEDNKVIIQTHFSQKEENDQLIDIAETLATVTEFNESATFTINDESNEGSLVLVVTPSVVK